MLLYFLVCIGQVFVSWLSASSDQKVINDCYTSQNGSAGEDSFSTSQSYDIEPLPGLETILQELLQEDG